MPLPLAPIAGVAIRYGSIALLAYAASRKVRPIAAHQDSEDTLDRVDEGLAAGRPSGRQQVNAEGRFRRIYRFGENGPGFEIDLAALGRLKLRRL